MRRSEGAKIEKEAGERGRVEEEVGFLPQSQTAKHQLAMFLPSPQHSVPRTFLNLRSQSFITASQETK